MATSPLRDLPEDSLASLDQFGNRLFIYPAWIRGYWHRRRRIVQGILMLVFLVLPWVKIGGHQAILLDLPRRQFAIFGLTFWAHDAPMIFFVLAGSVLSLALVTAVWGRVWCGWACPQTVFIEVIYRNLERWIEGNHIVRRKLNESPLSAKKAFKKIMKWSAYTAVSLIITHSFLAYFIGTDQLMEMVRRSPNDNWTSFLVMAFTTATILFDFGWFREQFCVIMCPYGRFQSVLLDEDSMSVIYDHDRGEPRRGTGADKSKQGDCIDCFKCVAVCPTAIDIRRGLQLECIACTACMDACDEVMTKIKKPAGLIRYSSESALKTGRMRWVRPRVAIYAGLLLVVLTAFGFALSKREAVHISILRAKESPYKDVVLDNGQTGLLNHFQLAMKNNEFQPLEVKVKVADAKLSEQIQLITATPTFPVAAGQSARTHIFVKFPRDLTAKLGELHVPIIFELTQEGRITERTAEIEIVGPRGNVTQ